MSKQPDWIADAIRETDSQFAPKPVDWNAERLRRANPSAQSAAVSAVVEDHLSRVEADGLAALDAHQTAEAEKEAERIERLQRDLAGGGA